ncbi:MAG: hypothetical protein QME96_13480 [Myxococcota bacterium]|nr:hypothetical protein [Myxococcota bacterium]
MNAGVFSGDIREFLRLLFRHGVRYVLVGGEAVIYHGHARLTGDVDVFYDRSPENARRLFTALDAFWSGVIPGIGSPEDLAAPGAVIMFGRPPNRLDLVGAIDGVTFDEAWDSRVTTALSLPDEEVQVHYIGLDALLKNKRAAGRPKDLEDLVYLEAAHAMSK